MRHGRVSGCELRWRLRCWGRLVPGCWLWPAACSGAAVVSRRSQRSRRRCLPGALVHVETPAGRYMCVGSVVANVRRLFPRSPPASVPKVLHGVLIVISGRGDDLGFLHGHERARWPDAHAHRVQHLFRIPAHVVDIGDMELRVSLLG